MLHGSLVRPRLDASEPRPSFTGALAVIAIAAPLVAAIVLVLAR